MYMIATLKNAIITAPVYSFVTSNPSGAVTSDVIEGADHCSVTSDVIEGADHCPDIQFTLINVII